MRACCVARIRIRGMLHSTFTYTCQAACAPLNSAQHAEGLANYLRALLQPLHHQHIEPPEVLLRRLVTNRCNNRSNRSMLPHCFWQLLDNILDTLLPPNTMVLCCTCAADNPGYFGQAIVWPAQQVPHSLCFSLSHMHGCTTSCETCMK